MILLIHPPVVKPSEPPAGIGKLCGVLRNAGINVSILDANLEGLLHLFGMGADLHQEKRDRWTERASRNLHRHLNTIRDLQAYRYPDAYRRAVSDLGRLLERSSASFDSGALVSLGNFKHEQLSPVRSADLIQSAEMPKKNPFYSWFSKRLKISLEFNEIPFVGFSLNYLSQALTAFAMVGFLKKECSQIKILLGGGLVTSWLSSPEWRKPFQGLVDYIIAGPGEEPLLALLRSSIPSSKSETSGILSIREERNEEAAAGNGDSAPDYSDFPLSQYLSPGTILPYAASRGCWWRKCLFCPETAEGNPCRAVPPGKVLADLAVLTAGMQPTMIHLLDNALSPNLLEELSNHPPDASWYGFARLTEHLTDEGFCASLKRARCAMIKVGLESGDQNVLDNLEKGIRLDTASHVLKTLAKVGIAVYVYLLFGTPSEDEKAARRTLSFIVEHADHIRFLNVAVFNLPVFAASAFQIEPREFYQGDLSLYMDFPHPRGWGRLKVRTFLDQEFRRHPAVAPILRNNPPVFTSNHAPFFV